MFLPPVYLLTCPHRAESLSATLASWAASDWRESPLPLHDDGPELEGEEWGEPARSRRVVRAFRRLMELALCFPGDEDEWVLLVEDDIDVHPQIGSLVGSWPALRDPRCGMATLFNPMLRSVPQWGEMERAFAANPETFLGAQALLLRRSWIKRALAVWDILPGMQAQRLARVFGGIGPIWVHRPSLVQHREAGSSWGAHTSRALDYSPRG